MNTRRFFVRLFVVMHAIAVVAYVLTILWQSGSLPVARQALAAIASYPLTQALFAAWLLGCGAFWFMVYRDWRAGGRLPA